MDGHDDQISANIASKLADLSIGSADSHSIADESAQPCLCGNKLLQPLIRGQSIFHASRRRNVLENVHESEVSVVFLRYRNPLVQRPVRAY